MQTLVEKWKLTMDLARIPEHNRQKCAENLEFAHSNSNGSPDSLSKILSMYAESNNFDGRTLLTE
jgi:hypothetical protein